MFHIRVCEHLTRFLNGNLVFYFWVFMHIDARDETLSQTLNIYGQGLADGVATNSIS